MPNSNATIAISVMMLKQVTVFHQVNYSKSAPRSNEHLRRLLTRSIHRPDVLSQGRGSRHSNAATNTEHTSHEVIRAKTPKLILRWSSEGVKWWTNATTASFEKPRETIKRIIAAYSLFTHISAPDQILERR